MRLGLIGWCTASGNGGMNTDIFTLSDCTTKWLIPKHPKLDFHQPYLREAVKCGKIYFSDPYKRPEELDDFLSGIDGILYIEHPIYRRGHFNDFDIVQECIQRDLCVFGIPMWEWWSEEEYWALNTSALWAVTSLTNNYLRSLQVVLETRGTIPKWSNKVFGNKWGVNLDCFSFRQRHAAREIVFVAGNGGYKDRKACSIVIPALNQIASGNAQVTIYSQQKISDLHEVSPSIHMHECTFPNRMSVYRHGDIFIFCSFWEGLCHGIYEACYSGGLVLTTDYPPMNECIPAMTIPVIETQTVSLGKKVAKAVPCMNSLLGTLRGLINSNIEDQSTYSHEWVKSNRDLAVTIDEMFYAFSQVINW